MDNTERRNGKFYSVANYLLQQGPWKLWGLAVLAGLGPVADLETALSHPRVPAGNIPFAMLVSVAVTVALTYPGLLYIARITGRMRACCGTARTVILSLIAAGVMFSRSDNFEPWVTPELLFSVVTYGLVLSAMYFFVKGKEPFFEARTNRG